MPTYSFQNIESNEEWSEMMTMAELDLFLKNNPKIIQTITTAPALGDSVRLGFKKSSNAFREQMRRIKKASDKSSTIDTGNIVEI